MGSQSLTNTRQSEEVVDLTLLRLSVVPLLPHFGGKLGGESADLLLM